MELQFAYFINKNLDFQVQNDGTIEVYRVYPKYRRLAIWIKPLWRLYTRYICTISIQDINPFMSMYRKKRIEVLQNDN